MRITFWGVRGSIPVPGPDCSGFGGNTSCVQVTADDGTELILDAGTGIRRLGDALAGRCKTVHILLTHLHPDHIQGLMFFAPLFDPTVEVTIWGPANTQRPLRDRLARYISDPLSPIEIRDLPARVKFNDASLTPWRLGDIEVTTTFVAHRGPTLGYRLQTGASSLCYLPDHEPGLGQHLRIDHPSWISGYSLARNASLLIHDGQYEEEEYRQRRGWGHSNVSDAVTFAHRSGCQQAILFHHDPAHTDHQLEELSAGATEMWERLGGQGMIQLAREGAEIDLGS
ncbi:MAG: MBL fold metallo-hydrolase [Solirubrobacteraceae bacterium]